MKKVAITAIISLFFGFLIHCVTLIMNHQELSAQQLKDFDSFIAGFELSNHKLLLTAQRLEASLDQAAAAKKNPPTRSVTALLRDQISAPNLTTHDATLLSSLLALSQYSPAFLSHPRYGELSLYSLFSDTLFSHFGAAHGKPSFESRRCDTTPLCSDIPKATGQAAHAYHRLVMRQKQPILITVATIDHQQHKVAQLLLDMPLQSWFAKPMFAVQSASGKRLMVDIFLTTHSSFSYVKQVDVNPEFAFRAHLSYLDIWWQSASLSGLYASLIFITLMAAQLTTSRASATRIEMLEHDWFADETQQIYNARFLKSQKLSRMINNDVEDSTILVRYGHQQLVEKYGETVALAAYQHLVTQIKAFIRNSDYLIDLKNGELLIYLPKCTTDNADKVLKKIFYNLREERYSDQQLPLKAFYFALSCKAGDNIQHILELARREIAKQAE